MTREGSGSLLIRAADAAPKDETGASIVDIYAQEKYPDTAGLSKMNFILHNKGTSEVASGNTLSDPQYLDGFGELRKFDFIVMNPPFSDKSWMDGIKPTEDKFKRFDGYGIPPEKNGDYAWFLHVLKALNNNGKAGIILPHGVLFRGNTEETIRKEILKRKYIKGIVGLPGNIFYGTGIPACIIIVDKENAEDRNGIFFIDASQGFKKDGSKNRLREQDIEKIVRTFKGCIEIEGYSRFVSNDEIEKKEGNLNVSRYIQKIDDTLPQNINSHLNGGIPKYDINSLSKLWGISPNLKNKLFKLIKDSSDVYEMAVEPDMVEKIIFNDSEIIKEINNEKQNIFNSWENEVKESLLNIDEDTNPKELIKQMSDKLLVSYKKANILDNYNVYDCLLNYWNEQLQDDVYIIKSLGYKAGCEIEYKYAQKKVTDASGETVQIDDKSKIKSFDGFLVPREIIESKYFLIEVQELEAMREKSETIRGELQNLIDEESGDNSIYNEVLNEDKDNITKTDLNKRIKEIDEKRVSKDAILLEKLIELFDESMDEAEKFVLENNNLNKYELHNKNGKLGKGKIKNAIKEARANAELPISYQDEYEALISYKNLVDELDIQENEIKEKETALDNKVVDKYSDLSVDEIKVILLEDKWMNRLLNDISNELDLVLNEVSNKVVTIAKRYRKTLNEIEEETKKSRDKVHLALERMGYKW